MMILFLGGVLTGCLLTFISIILYIVIAVRRDR